MHEYVSGMEASSLKWIVPTLSSSDWKSLGLGAALLKDKRIVREVFAIMREIDLWLCFALSINGSREAIFRSLFPQHSCDHRSCWGIWGQIFECVLGVLASWRSGVFSLSSSYLPNATIRCAWPHVHCDVRLRSVSGVESLLESWAGEVCHRGLMESALFNLLSARNECFNVSGSKGTAQLSGRFAQRYAARWHCGS